MHIIRFFGVSKNLSLMIVSKILIATGSNMDGDQTSSEIVDLTIKGGNMCKNWPHFPIGVYGATGGFIGSTVMICGGKQIICT